MANRQFEFYNTVYTLTAVLNQVLEYIGNHLPAGTTAAPILFKAKVIVTELLTNSLKHSGSSQTIIQVNITGNDLRITKTDHGYPLSLINAGHLVEEQIPITHDILHTLYAVLETETELRFLCNENNIADILTIDNMVEHFGLLIITKSADEFIYKHDYSSGSNIFTILLKL